MVESSKGNSEIKSTASRHEEKVPPVEKEKDKGAKDSSSEHRISTEAETLLVDFRKVLRRQNTDHGLPSLAFDGLGAKQRNNRVEKPATIKELTAELQDKSLCRGAVEELIKLSKSGDAAATGLLARLTLSIDNPAEAIKLGARGYINEKLNVDSVLLKDLKEKALVAIEDAVTRGQRLDGKDLNALAVVISGEGNSERSFRIGRILEQGRDQSLWMDAVVHSIEVNAPGSRILVERFAEKSQATDITRNLETLSVLAAAGNGSALSVLSTILTRSDVSKGAQEQVAATLKAAASSPEQARLVIDELLKVNAKHKDSGSLLHTLGEVAACGNAVDKDVRDALSASLSKPYSKAEQASAVAGMFEISRHWTADDLALVARTFGPESLRRSHMNSDRIPEEAQKRLLTAAAECVASSQTTIESRKLALGVVSAFARHADSGVLESVKSASGNRDLNADASGALLNIEQRALNRTLASEAKKAVETGNWGMAEHSKEKAGVLAYSQEGKPAGKESSRFIYENRLRGQVSVTDRSDSPAVDFRNQETQRQIQARLILLNTLPPALRKELGGSEKPVDPKVVAQEIQNGTLGKGDNKILLENVEAKLSELKKARESQFNTASKDLDALNKDRDRLAKELADLTKEGVSFLDRVAFWSGKTEEFEKRQADLVKQIRDTESRIAEQTKKVSEENGKLQLAELMVKVGDHTKLMQDGKVKEADRMAVEMWGRYGADLQKLAPSAWDELAGPGALGKNAFARLKESGEAYNGKLPDLGGGFKNGIESLSHLTAEKAKLSDGNATREQALKAIESDPELVALMGGAKVLSKELPILQQMFNSGMEGTKFEEFVKDARRRSGEVEKALKEVESHVPAIQERLSELKKLQNESTDEKTKEELKKRIDAFEQALSLFDPKSSTRVGLDNMVKTLNSPNFNESTFMNWLKREGVIIGVAIGCAVAAVATVVSFGAASPILIAAVGAGAAIIGSELAKEGLYHLDIGLGDGTRSRLGSYASGEKVFDAASGQMRDQTFMGDVALPYAKQFAIDFALCLATMGIGAVASRGINSVISRIGAQRFSQLLARNAGTIEELTTRAAMIEQEMAKEGGETFAKRFAREFIDEAGDELKEAATEDALQKAMSRYNSNLGFLAGCLVATGKGVRFNYARGGGPVNVQAPDLEAFKHSVSQFEAQGHQVEHTTDGRASVTIGGKVFNLVFEQSDASNSGSDSKSHDAESNESVERVSGKTASVTGSGKYSVDGPHSSVDIKAVDESGVVRDFDVRLSDGAMARVHNGDGKISGHGSIEVTGANTNIEINVPEGQVLRVYLNDTVANVTVSPDSKGRVEVVVNGGGELPRALKEFAADNPGRLYVMDRRDVTLPLGGNREFDTPRVLDQQGLDRVISEISETNRRLNEPITIDQWRQIFDGMAPHEREMALEIMRQSAPNMNSRSVDQQMKLLGELLRNSDIPFSVVDTQEVPSKSKVKVYVSDASSAGNALAHLFNKNNEGVDIDIVVLDSASIADIAKKREQLASSQEQLAYCQKRLESAKEKLAGHRDGTSVLSEAELAKTEKDHKNFEEAVENHKSAVYGNVVVVNDIPQVNEQGEYVRRGGLLAETSGMVFDDINSFTAEQRAALSGLDNLVVADLNGFDRGVNFFDMASLTGNADSIKAKLEDIMQNVRQLQTGDALSIEKAVEQYLKTGGAGALQTRSGQRIVSAPVDSSIKIREEIVRSVGYEGDARIDALYRHATEPMVRPEDLHNYLGEVARQHAEVNELRRQAGLDPLPSTVEEYQTAALMAVKHGGNIFGYPSMVNQVRQLEANIKAELKNSGIENDSDYIVVSGLEQDRKGSSYLVNHLYGAVTGHKNFMTMDQLNALKNNPELAEKLLAGKRIVFLDDYRNSGEQQARHLAGRYNETLSKIKDTKKRPLVTDVTVAVLAKHTLPAESQNPFELHGVVNKKKGDVEVKKQVLVPVVPGTTVQAGFLRVHSVSAENLQGVMSEQNIYRKGLRSYEQLLIDLGSGTMYEGSPVATGIVTPYGMPNNNARFFLALEKSLGLPARYKNQLGLFMNARQQAWKILDAQKKTA